METVKPSSSSGTDQWHLVAQGDWLAGQKFAIHHHAVLGRESGCDITIPGTHLSRRHAELAISGNKLLVRDLGSSNGTYVNGAQVTEAELLPGDEVRFDVLVFKVEGPDKELDRDATIIRQVEPVRKKTSTPKANHAVDKQWKTKPTSVGNRDQTVQISTTQKAVSSLWSVMAVLVTLSTIAAIAYLIMQL